jgi:hypothetical protein
MSTKLSIAGIVSLLGREWPSLKKRRSPSVGRASKREEEKKEDLLVSLDYVAMINGMSRIVIQPGYSEFVNLFTKVKPDDAT